MILYCFYSFLGINVKMINCNTIQYIAQLIGNFGKWQAFIIFPLGIHFMFGSFQTLVTPFLSLEGDFYCKIEAPDGIFDSLSQWRTFANPIDNVCK